MPRLKQPPTLLKMATDRLVDFLAKRCNECSVNGSLEELRQVVTFIKSDIGPNVPWQLGADFFERLLDTYFYAFKYPRKERPESHKRAVLECIMDRKIVGLTVSTFAVESMDMEDGPRLRGVSTLLLDKSRRYNLETFHLEDLVTLSHQNHCTDSDLEIIAKACPKLEYLNISRSQQVTDNGIRALNSCPELRVVILSRCRNVTSRGVQDLLSAHQKIKNFRFDRFVDGTWTVYPSITHYDIELKTITNSDLCLIAEKFPNLRSLNIYGKLDHDACLSSLESLKKLTELVFEPEGNTVTWDALKPLLRSIGTNITKLDAISLTCRATIYSSVTQADLEFLHKRCPNIRSLSFDYDSEDYGDILVIPPFENLIHFRCHSFLNNPHYARLQFGVMSELQTLLIEQAEMTTAIVEAMILDNIKFPRLNHITIRESYHYDLNRLEETVKINNIDLRLTVE